MTPTNELRFVRRSIPLGGVVVGGGQSCQIVRILQQKWVSDQSAMYIDDKGREYEPSPEEWRDVPEVSE